LGLALPFDPLVQIELRVIVEQIRSLLVLIEPIEKTELIHLRSSLRRGRYPRDGSLDYPDELLRKSDYTVCSIHSRFGLGKATQT
jgi:hypothetical protein